MSKVYSGSWSAYGTFEIEADSAKEAIASAHRELGNLDFGTDFETLDIDGSTIEMDSEDNA